MLSRDNILGVQEKKEGPFGFWWMQDIDKIFDDQNSRKYADIFRFKDKSCVDMWKVYDDSALGGKGAFLALNVVQQALSNYKCALSLYLGKSSSSFYFDPKGGVEGDGSCKSSSCIFNFDII
jgi:hypothetical protein